MQKVLWAGLAMAAGMLSLEAEAQVVPDGTLGAESSRVRRATVRGRDADLIEGGATRGQNLFHSFQEFGVREGDAAYFANPAAIENIFGRVTGSNPSNILGTLGVDGSANLFLMNPNGILFGPNSSLDVSGSFVGTTANAIGFGELGFFSATNPEAASPLLTIDPSAFLFNQIGTGAIVSQSRALGNTSGQNLLLLGGNIVLDGSILLSLGGRVELGAVSGIGAVPVVYDNNAPRIEFPAEISRADMVLQNNSSIFSTGGGSIAVNAQNIDLLNSNIFSSLLAGEGGRSGDVVINATGTLTLDRSNISRSGLESSLGDTGNLLITAQSVQLTNRSGISSGGQRNAGDIRLNIAGELALSGSFINSFNLPGSSGNASNIFINARSIRLTDSSTNPSRIGSDTRGQGSAGRVVLVAQDAITLSNSTIQSNSSPFPSGTVSRASSGGIDIEARLLSLEQSSQISSSSFGAGRSGNISINTREAVTLNNSRIGSDAAGSTEAGDIQIQAGQLALLNNSVISAETSNNFEPGNVGQGDAGNITITAQGLSLRDAGIISTSSSSSRGNAGDITIRANDVEIIGFLQAADLTNSGTLANSDGLLVSQITSEVTNNSISDIRVQGGTITIDANQLRLNNGGTIATNVQQARGQAGNVIVRAAESVEISGRPRFNSPSTLSSTLQTDSIGTGGSVQVVTGQLRLSDGGEISAGTTSQGNAGRVSIEASNIDLRGLNTLITTQVSPSGRGNGGNLDIQTQRLLVQDNAQINSNTFGIGNAGNINVRANEIELTDIPDPQDVNTGLFTTVDHDATGDAGNLVINTDRLIINNGAVISASTVGQGNTGSITVQANRGIDLNNNSSISSEVRQSATGNSQNITLATPELTLQQNSEISATTNGNGRAGSIVIRGTTENTPASSVLLNNSNISTEVQQNGVVDAANAPSNIDIRTRALNLDNGSNVTANTSGQGNAGNITVQEAERIALSNNSRISTAVNSGAVGAGGNIQTTTAALTLTNNSQISAATSSTGNPGSISVQNADTVSLNNSTISSAVNPGGIATQRSNIDIQTRTLNLNNGSNVIASTSNRGDAGNITVRDADTVNLNNSTLSSTVNSGATGSGGNVTLDTRTLELNQGNVTASTNGNGRAGDVTISNAEQVSLNRGTISTAVGATGVGQGGNISVQTGQLNLENRSDITSSTANRGDTGSITLNATQGVNLRRNSRISNRVETGATGNSQRITLNTPNLSLSDDSAISAATDGNGQAGDIQIQNADTVSLSNSSISTQVQRNAVVPNASSIRAQTLPNANQGSITIDTRSLNLTNGAEITASTEGRGRAGNVTVNNADTITLSDNSTISSAVRRNGQGRGGSVNLETDDLNLDNSRITASTNGRGRAGNITVNANRLNVSNGGRIISSTNRGRPAGTVTLRDLDQLTLSGSNRSGRTSGIFANTSGSGRGGRINVTTQTLDLSDGAAISTTSRNNGRAGDIQITASEALQVEDGTISTRAVRSAGGNIQIQGGNLDLSQGSNISTDVSTGEGNGGAIVVDANNVRLQDDSDIQTRVGPTGTGNGGDITVNADSVIAFDDSDIITESPERGGDINLNTPVFFGSGYVPNLTVDNADNNGRVDLDASGAVSAGAVQTPDTSFIQNSLADLPANAIDPDNLIANSCIARTETGGTFLITGTGGLPTDRPDTLPPSSYPTDTIRTESDAGWQPGDPIVEPQGVYQLPDGELILSHECP